MAKNYDSAMSRVCVRVRCFRDLFVFSSLAEQLQQYHLYINAHTPTPDAHSVAPTHCQAYFVYVSFLLAPFIPSVVSFSAVGGGGLFKES